MKRIIISGAGGFLGSNIIKAALREDIPVVAITTKADISAGGAVSVVSTQAFLGGELRLDENDVFINCMFPTNADGVRMANGLKAVYRTIRAAKESGVGAFINISSQSVYPSKRENPAKETDGLSLESPYAVGKYSTEEYTDIVFTDIPHCSIRLASLLGVGYEQRIVNRMAEQALAGNTLKVIGGMQRYGFLDVRDAASGLVRMSQSDPGSWKEVYNLGRMESCTLIDVAELIVGELKSRGISAGYEVSEGVDNRNSSVDASLFMQSFDWAPEVSLAQTVRDVVDSKLDLS